MPRWFHAEHRWLADHKGPISSTGLVPHGGEITANVLLISMCDDITTAALIAPPSPHRLLHLSLMTLKERIKAKAMSEMNRGIKLTLLVLLS